MAEIKTNKQKDAKKDAKQNMFMHVFLSRYFNLIVLVFVISLLAIGYMYLIKPKSDSISELAQKAKEAEDNEYKDLEAYNKKLEVYVANYEKLEQTDKDRINSMIGQAGEDEELLAMMEKLVVSQGLILSSIDINSGTAKASPKKAKTAAAKTADGLGIININMQVIGLDYKGLKKFLEILEKNLRIMDVNNLEFSPEEKSVSLAISTYYAKP